MLNNEKFFTIKFTANPFAMILIPAVLKTYKFLNLKQCKVFWLASVCMIEP